MSNGSKVSPEVIVGEAIVGVRHNRDDGFDALNRALDQRDSLDLEVKGARAILIALVHKYGPFDLSPHEILASTDRRIDISTGPDGFSYRAKRT